MGGVFGEPSHGYGGDIVLKENITAESGLRDRERLDDWKVAVVMLLHLMLRPVLAIACSVAISCSVSNGIQ
jgi:hypothetical protein